jgi:hypothetical protein
MKVTRRQMILGLLGAGATRWMPGFPLTRALAAPVGRFPPVLEGDRQRALLAAADRVLPGVVEAGFEDYMNYWLAREPFSRANDWKPMLNAGALHLDRLAKERHKRAFADCKPEQQDVLLGEFQQGRVTAKRFRSSSFFQRLLMLAVESYLSDPKYGGNRDMVGFRFAGRMPCWWAPKKVHRHVHPDQGLVD